MKKVSILIFMFSLVFATKNIAAPMPLLAVDQSKTTEESAKILPAIALLVFAESATALTVTEVTILAVAGTAVVGYAGYHLVAKHIMSGRIEVPDFSRMLARESTGVRPLSRVVDDDVVKPRTKDQECKMYQPAPIDVLVAMFAGFQSVLSDINPKFAGSVKVRRGFCNKRATYELSVKNKPFLYGAWDSCHGEIEIYSLNGTHLCSIGVYQSPGVIKPAVKGRVQCFDGGFK